MSEYSQKLVQKARVELEPIFERELSDEEVCRHLHEIAAIVRVVFGD